MRTPRITAALVAALAVGIAGCGGSDEEPAAAKRDAPHRERPLYLTIGNSVPLSGELSDLGPAARRSGALALAEIEKALKATRSDEEVKLVTEDGGTSAARARRSLERLIARGASCVVGPWASDDTIVVARELAIPSRVALISPAATLDAISTLDDDGLVNRTAPPHGYQGRALAAAIAADLGGAKGRTLNVLARDDAYGEAVAVALERAWRERGGKVGSSVVYDPDDDDLDAVAERGLEGRPDALVVAEFPPAFARLVRSLERTGNYRPGRTWGTDMLASTKLAAKLPSRLTDGLRGTTAGTPDRAPATRAFARRFGAERKPFDAQTFDAVLLCYLAAVAAGSADGDELAAWLAAVSSPPGKRYTWQQLPAAVRALRKGREIDLVGASGPLDLDRAGDPRAVTYDLYQYRDGELVVVGEQPVKVP